MKDTKPQNPEIVKAINAFSQNKFDEAEKICQEVLSSGEDSDANHIIGCIRMGERKFEESIAYLNRSLADDKENLGILISLGCALSSSKNYSDSIDIFTKVIKKNPEISQVHFYLGESYRQLGRFEESLNAFKSCLKLTPDHIGCQLMIGVIYEELKKFDQAIDFYKSCINTYPEYMEPHINLGMCYLLTGNYDEGWNEYEWRLKLPAKVYKKEFVKPKWVGQSLENKTILIICEQGFGDTIQFIRYAELFAKDGAKVRLVSQDELIPFLECQKYIDKVVGYDDDLPEYDYYTYMMSIPKVMEWKPSMDTQQFPYITHKDKSLEYISKGKLNIGIVTQARTGNNDENNISFNIQSFKGVFSKKKHNVVSLDYFLTKNDSASNIIDVFPDAQNFIDTTNIISHLDLIITVDTAAVHIAGALNKKTWLMLAAVPGWRWDLNFKDSTPWYSSVEIFRQERNNNWNTIINNIKKRLSDV